MRAAVHVRHNNSSLRYPAAEASERLGVSPHSLYARNKKFAQARSGDTEKDAGIRRLETERLRVTEERDILKKATAYSVRNAK